MRSFRRFEFKKAGLSIRDTLKVLYRKIRGRLRTSSAGPAEQEKTLARLPGGGEMISLETALNSRCSSAYDDDQKTSHWGMFDRHKKLSDRDIKRIIDLSRIQRFSPKPLSVRAEQNMLFFITAGHSTGAEKDWIMVESGMHQQAVSLICAALGAGSLILNMGLDGSFLPQGDFAAVRMRIDPMKPSYEGSYWSTSPPKKNPKWKKGNLPDPRREGPIPLLSALKDYALQNPDGESADLQSLSQILWAARGRTPHLYLSVPWGTTIPTWTGKQDLSRLLILLGDHLHEYQNWWNKRPSHFLAAAGGMDADATLFHAETLGPWNAFIILTTDDPHSRGLWEVGYQLLNIVLQAHVLNVGYQSILLEQDQKKKISEGLMLRNPVAMVALKAEPELSRQVFSPD